MANHKALDGNAVGPMLLVCLIWGLQQVALKAASGDVSPLMQIAVRSGVAAGLVGLLMATRGERLNLLDGPWRSGLLVGLLFAVEVLLVGEGLRFTSASHMIIFIYTAPIFTALGMQWKVPEERLSAVQWLGICLAFGGIVVSFVGPNHSRGGTGDGLFGDMLALMAGFVWAVRTVALRISSLAKETATKALLYQLVVAFIGLTLAAACLGQTAFKPTAIAWSSLLFQSLFVSFASFLTWLWLLGRYQASSLGAFSMLTPLFGLAFGVLLLDETLEPRIVIGSVMVIGGIGLVSGYRWLNRLFARVA